MRLKPVTLTFFLLIAGSSGPAYSSNLDNKTLINSCKEAVAIYSDERQKMNKYAALTTSLSEAFEGGYCAGAIQTYMKLNNWSCQREDWYTKAELLASLKPDDYRHISLNELLSKLCR